MSDKFYKQKVSSIFFILHLSLLSFGLYLFISIIFKLMLLMLFSNYIIYNLKFIYNRNMKKSLNC